ncbi:hypothetical protein NDU88_002405 [Pleurodeles waltl]|uniref:Uncharacterized protein n=1 Tax=Pleurodeles waltl TaxID=8319 RepID=A0AAV7VDQ5_PLEWA|nr:hypothetical protein NDU88_002405 [Pleurodeles waltl]
MDSRGALVPSDTGSSKSGARGCLWTSRGSADPKTVPCPRRDRPVAGAVEQPDSKPVPTGRGRPRPPGPRPEVPPPLLCPRESLEGGRAGERRGRECAAPEPTGAGVVWDPVSRRTGCLEPNEQLTGKRRRDLGGRKAQRVERWGLHPPRPQKTALRAAAPWAVGPEIRAPVPCWALAPHGAPSAGCAPGPGGAEIEPALERGKRAEEQGRGDEKERQGPRPGWTHTLISLIWCPEGDIGPLRDGAQLAQQLHLTGTPGGSRGNSRFACSRTITPEEPNS